MKKITILTLLRLHKLALGIAALCMATACSDAWLDVKARKNQAVPSTLRDFQAMMDNVVMNYPVPALGEIASDGHYTTDAAWQGSSITPVQRNAYTWTNRLPVTNLSDWFAMYTKILYSNIVLDGLGKVTPATDAEQGEKQHIRGQALFMRAKDFYHLASVFAPPYVAGNTTDELGIPLRLSSDITLPTVRSGLRETYDRITADLHESLTLLPDRPLYMTRASRQAAHALLARIYLQTGDYTQALEQAQACLNIHDELLDFNTLNPSATFIGTNTEIIFLERLRSYPLIGTNCYIDEELYAQYTPDDLRQVVYFRRGTNGLLTFKGNYNSFTTSYQFAGLATDEVQLILAECLARQGNTAGALESLNRLRRYRFSNNQPFVPLAASGPAEALRLVLDERRRELVLRGLRWGDLRRLNRDPDHRVTLTRMIDGETFVLEPESFRYTFPIPDDIVEQSGIPQNKGWEQ